MAAIEKQVDELAVLVDGHEPWSHRTRLHELSTRVAGELAVRESAEKVTKAVRAHSIERQNVWTRVREWGAFALAAVAIARTLGWL